jgi:hypothetical protein
MCMFLLLLLAGHSDPHEEMVNRLGDDDFDVREKASKELWEDIDFSLYKKLREVKTDDLETRYRIGKLTSRYELEQSKKWRVDLKGYKKWPFIDSLPSGYPRRWDIACSYRKYAQVTGTAEDNAPNWSDYRKATELWCADRIFFSVQSSLRSAKDFGEYLKLQKGEMRKLHKDLEEMKKGDDRQWKGWQCSNPAR